MAKKAVVRTSAKQYKEASALIKGLCCNYDRPSGGCLLLDDGEVVHCPQLITQSLICKYFRDVLLEDKEAKALKAEIMGADHVKVCGVCGQHFRAISNRARYCSRCAKKVKNRQAAERMRKYRG